MTTETTGAGASTTESAPATDATPSTMLTGTAPTGAADDAAGAATDADGTTTTAEGATEGGEAAAGAPEAYADFTLPEGATLAAEVLDEARGLAKGLGLSQEKAQQVVDLLAKTHAGAADAAAQAQKQTFADAKRGWVEELKADKEIGGDKLAESLATATAAMQAVASPQLIALLAHSGLGDNVHIVKHFLAIAPAVLPDRTVQSGAQPTGAQRKSTAAVLYANTTPN